MAPSSKPILVLVPGASQSPSHYEYLLHLLQSNGYGTLSALLPSTGYNTSRITAQDDANYIRSRMLLPVLDVEEHDVILITHSYSGMPGSAAAKGLGKSERASQKKKTSVLGQIFLAAMIPKGGDGKDVTAMFGGQMPPHIVVDEPGNMIRCPDPKPPLYQDIPEEMANVAVASCMNPCLSSWTTPCPPASWNETAYHGRCAFIRTIQDRCIPYHIQNMMINASEQEWILQDIDSGHSPQLSQPEKLADIILELVKHFETM
ncbi:hypothetical protein ACLMJK_000098 [Lecanora helva]